MRRWLYAVVDLLCGLVFSGTVSHVFSCFAVSVTGCGGSQYGMGFGEGCGGLGRCVSGVFDVRGCWGILMRA